MFLPKPLFSVVADTVFEIWNMLSGYLYFIFLIKMYLNRKKKKATCENTKVALESTFPKTRRSESSGFSFYLRYTEGAKFEYVVVTHFFCLLCHRNHFLQCKMYDCAGCDLYRRQCCSLPISTYEISADLGCFGPPGWHPGAEPSQQTPDVLDFPSPCRALGERGKGRREFWVPRWQPTAHSSAFLCIPM